MSMSPEIMKRYIRLTSAQDIWKALSKAFYDGADELQVFALNQRAFSAKQNERTLSNVLKILNLTKKSIQRQRVHIFLAGLDGEFEQICGEILRKDPSPELEECYALFRKEFVRHTTMNGEPGNSKASAMVTRRLIKTDILKNDKTKQGPTILSLLMVPINLPINTPNAAFVEANIRDDSTGQTSALVAAAGNSDKVFNISTHVSNSAWIIDYVVTDHMTFDSRHVLSLKPSSQKFVSITNGALTSIIHNHYIIYLYYIYLRDDDKMLNY
ncbi:hypothetical protein Lal_00019724, partial [Lupinus albus]